MTHADSLLVALVQDRFKNGTLEDTQIIDPYTMENFDHTSVFRKKNSWRPNLLCDTWNKILGFDAIAVPIEQDDFTTTWALFTRKD